MLVKLLVVITLIVILASLASGLFFLVRDKGDSTRTVKALTVRIGLSIFLFLMLMLAYAAGLIQPNNPFPT